VRLDFFPQSLAAFATGEFALALAVKARFISIYA
jgi:hypothetical protein